MPCGEYYLDVHVELRRTSTLNSPCWTVSMNKIPSTITMLHDAYFRDVSIWIALCVVVRIVAESEQHVLFEGSSRDPS